MINPKTNNSDNCIKNRQDFLFIINGTEGFITESKPTVISDCKKLKIYLNGIVYNRNINQLLEGFQSQGADFVRSIEGSFIIFLIIESDFFIMTDKVNSLKGYYAFIDNKWYVSNDIDALPKEKCKINLKGLACYLANGVMFNDLTLFEEIHSAKRACIHTFLNGQVKVEKYWDDGFVYQTSEIKTDSEYKEELRSLLVQAVKQRHACSENAAISLSAGYDSRGILGILHNEIHANNVSCLSYANLPMQTTDSDPYLSKELANLYNCPHSLVSAYSGKFMDQLINNSKEGKCIANFCDELDAWNYLSSLEKYIDLFVGDHCLGSHGTNLDRFLIRRDASRIEALEGFISPELFAILKAKLIELFDEILETTTEIPDIQDKLDFLDIDQEINHIYMPWREHFTSKVGFVHNPYLDSSILEFRKKIPPNLRRNKHLFIESVRDIMPESFTVPLAKKSGTAIDWQQELCTHKDELVSFISNSNSRLDEIISKNEVIDLLKHSVLTFKKGAKRRSKELKHKDAYNLINKVSNIFMGSKSNQKQKTPTLEELMLRLLIIHFYLSA